MFGTNRISGNEQARILQAVSTSRLRKIEASLATNILQRKELERQLAKYKDTYHLTTNSLKENR